MQTTNITSSPSSQGPSSPRGLANYYFTHLLIPAYLTSISVVTGSL